MTAIVILLILIFLALVVLILGVRNLRFDIGDVVDGVTQTNKLMLNPRTRQSVAAMQSGATDEIQEGRALGRASVAKRVVVGGEDDSQQKRALQGQIGIDDGE